MEFIQHRPQAISAASPIEVSATGGSATYYVGEAIDYTPVADAWVAVAKVCYAVPAGGAVYLTGHAGLQPTGTPLATVGHRFHWSIRIGASETDFVSTHMDSYYTTTAETSYPPRDVLNTWAVFVDLEAGNYVSYLYAARWTMDLYPNVGTHTAALPSALDTVGIVALVAGSGTVAGAYQREWVSTPTTTGYYPYWWFGPATTCSDSWSYESPHEASRCPATPETEIQFSVRRCSADSTGVFIWVLECAGLGYLSVHVEGTSVTASVPNAFTISTFVAEAAWTITDTNWHDIRASITNDGGLNRTVHLYVDSVEVDSASWTEGSVPEVDDMSVYRAFQVGWTGYVAEEFFNAGTKSTGIEASGDILTGIP